MQHAVGIAREMTVQVKVVACFWIELKCASVCGGGRAVMMRRGERY